MKLGTYNSVSLIAKIILLELATSSLSSLATSSTDKAQCFVHLSFNSTSQLINGISSDLQKLLWYFNSTAIAAFSRIPSAAFGAGWATVFANNLAV